MPTISWPEFLAGKAEMSPSVNPLGHSRLEQRYTISCESALFHSFLNQGTGSYRGNLDCCCFNITIVPGGHGAQAGKIVTKLSYCLEVTFFFFKFNLHLAVINHSLFSRVLIKLIMTGFACLFGVFVRKSEIETMYSHFADDTPTVK